MSASHRSLARLPLDIFTDLQHDQTRDAESLRCLICSRLKQAQTRQGKTTEPVTTVGKLLKMSPSALLRALDPILNHGAFRAGLFSVLSFEHPSSTNQSFLVITIMIVECQELIHRTSLHCAPSPTSALELLHGTSNNNAPRRHLPTGMPSLDKSLRGGFCIGTISELVGRAGVGKSQLALQLCIMAAKYNQGSIYIDTEKKLSLQRLKEMAEKKCGMASQQEVANAGEFSYGTSLLTETEHDTGSVIDFYGVQSETNFPFKSAREVLTNMTVYTAGSTNELLSVVEGIEEDVLFRNQQAEQDDSKYPVSLVILDSIAAPTRRDFGSESAPQRVSAVLQLAQMLKRLADQLQLVVVVINQVGLNDSVNVIESSQGGDFVAVKAALGTAWSHCLSTRLLLEHERDPHRLNTSVDDAHENMHTNIMDRGGDYAWKHKRGSVRRATVVKSNVAGMESMFYEIGVDGLDEIRFNGEM